MLVEFASNSVPPMIEQPFYRVQLEGWIPIIAHPERNIVFQAKPELLVSLDAGRREDAGHRGQPHGRVRIGGARIGRGDLAPAGLVHFVATDAHNTKKRPPQVREALAVIQELAGERVATAVTRDNPQAVLDGTSLPYEPDPQLPRKQGGLMKKVRRLFGPS